MATVQSSVGEINYFADFTGNEWTIAETANDSMQFGDLRIVGTGKDGTASGIVNGESDPCLSGVARFISSATDNYSIGLTTALMFDVAKMGTIVMETRVQMADLDTKEFYFGLSALNSDTIVLEDGLCNIDTTAPATITLTASSLCGFLFSSEATLAPDWFAVYNGGTTAGETVAANVDLDAPPVAGEWQILRLEVDNDATARWYVNGRLLKTLNTALSTTTDVAAIALLHNLASGATETIDVDYILLRANRDWAV